MKTVECHKLTIEEDQEYALKNQGVILNQHTLPSGFVTPCIDLKIVDVYLVAV